ncbi:hypothetical protein [Lacinutrix himadriensis]|uniref:hypothetical protein n=1 Tax=Lacinutrix himadriensis TaxID=641549 RepID=UPI0006E2EE8B|nr:hypothetical protein [Lacinutrix himadriensis]
MKHLSYLLAFIFITSCGSEKTIQLPEISHTEITEVLDISPAYIFYDATKPDSLELNRKNLISTTNWLVNVDKRLTLDQVIPQITFLQNKKKNSSHKKEGVKNYYTCNDTSIKNLGFLEFTDINYKTYNDVDEGFERDTNTYDFNIIMKSRDSLILDSYMYTKTLTIKTIINKLSSEIESIKTYSKDPDHGFESIVINFSFNRNLTFQDYISIKSLFIDFKLESTTISNNEFIY